MDLYKTEKRVLSTKKKFKDICKNCFSLVEKFERSLKLNNYSSMRILKYWNSLRSLHSQIGKCFDKATKEDLEKTVIKIDSKNWSEWTKSDTKKIMKFFYRWLVNNTLEGDYPDIVKWIKTTMKRNNKKIPEEILTKEEIKLMADSANNPRDKALILILYESGCRVSELLGMKIKNITFDQFGCYILVSGKTGWRRVRIIDYSKDLLNWLDIHPLKNDQNAHVWINLENLKDLISPSAVNKILKNSAKKCNISKPIHAHAFRHARATHLAKQLPEAVMKKFFGWTNDSNMASVYYHLSGKDIDDALLKIHGIKAEEIKEEKNIGIKICQKCGENNSMLSHFCKKCNSPLDLKIMIEIDEYRKKFDEMLKDFLVYYAEKDKNFKKVFVQFVKEKKAEDLFLTDRGGENK
jgi:integrase/ribosomal protein L40E